jgi:hypothetical protein
VDTGELDDERKKRLAADLEKTVRSALEERKA